MLKTQSKLFALFILITCLFISSCGSPFPTEATTYIAKISNGPESARIGILIDNGKFILYICSLDEEFNRLTARWFVNDLEPDGTVDGLSPDGVRVNGSIIKNTFTGIITNLDGKVTTFRGSAIPAGGPAGLYRGEGIYNGQAVILGAVFDTDNVTFVTTVQVEGKNEFITPISDIPFRINDTLVKITVGDLKEKIEATLVTSLE